MADRPTNSPRRPVTVGPRRRRVTAQQYRRRRVVMAFVVILALGGVYGVANLLFGTTTNDRTAAAPSDTSTTTGAVSNAPATDDAGSPIESTTIKTSPAAPVDAATPTAADPLKLYIAGDSDAGAFGPYLATLMTKTKLVTTTLDYKVSTGLARPDFFDWPARFATKLAEVNPAIVVLTFGGNDAQGLADSTGKFSFSRPTGADGADVGWRAEYAKRVAAVIEQLTAGGRHLIWVGIPNDVDPGQSARLAVQDQVVRQQVAKHPGVVYIDTWNLFSGRNGGYADFVIDPRDGEAKAVRAKDGFHLNQTGAEILAVNIAEAVKNDLRARGASI